MLHATNWVEALLTTATSRCHMITALHNAHRHPPLGTASCSLQLQRDDLGCSLAVLMRWR
jgi:hypothetical protein